MGGQIRTWAGIAIRHHYTFELFKVEAAPILTRNFLTKYKQPCENPVSQNDSYPRFLRLFLGWKQDQNPKTYLRLRPRNQRRIGTTSKAATATPKGNIQNPTTGRNPRTPKTIKIRPKSRRNPGGICRFVQTCRRLRIRRRRAFAPPRVSRIGPGLQNEGLAQPLLQCCGRGLRGLQRREMPGLFNDVQLRIWDQISHEAVPLYRGQPIMHP